MIILWRWRYRQCLSDTYFTRYYRLTYLNFGTLLGSLVRVIANFLWLSQSFQIPGYSVLLYHSIVYIYQLLISVSNCYCEKVSFITVHTHFVRTGLYLSDIYYLGTFSVSLFGYIIWCFTTQYLWAFKISRSFFWTLFRENPLHWFFTYT